MDKEYIERGMVDIVLSRMLRREKTTANKQLILKVMTEIRTIHSADIPHVVRCEFCKHCLEESDHAEIRHIKTIPVADVVEVVHGEWEIKSEIHKMFDDVDEELYVECPFCKRTFWVPYEFEDEKILAYAREHYPYCNCGAKMDGATDNNVGGKQGVQDDV